MSNQSAPGTTIIERLFSSFTELERAIEGAKASLNARPGVPQTLIDRLNSYDGILEKQRVLATRLCEHINTGNWAEVGRQVNLINGLSAMIKDDACLVLKILAEGSEAEIMNEELIC